MFYLLLVAGGYGAFLVTGLPHLPNDALGEIHMYAHDWLSDVNCIALSGRSS